MFTDNGPDYRCPICGKDIIGEIGHECREEENEEEGGEKNYFKQDVENFLRKPQDRFFD